MAIAFDAQSTLALGTGDRSWTHTPVGTPKGVLVIIVDGVDTDQVVGVTYGGTAMTQVPLSPLLHVSPETGSVHAFFLGASVPTGAKLVAIDRLDATNYIAAAFSVTATADTQVHDTSTFDSGATTAPSATLTITASSFVAGGLYSGLAAPGATEVAETTQAVTGDFGADNGEISRGSTIKTADFAYGWTQASDDGAVLAVAISEFTASPVTVTPGLLALTLATFAATVTASDNQSVIPGVVALTTATFAPAVSVTANQLVTPGVVALSVSTFAPTVTATAHQLVTPPVASLSLTTFAPTVTGGAGTTVTPSTASLALATFAPTIGVSDHKTVTPTTAGLITAAFAPTITASDHKTVVPGVASLALAAFAPSVTVTAHQTVTPPTAVLTITTYAPNVTSGGQIVIPIATASAFIREVGERGSRILAAVFGGGSGSASDSAGSRIRGASDSPTRGSAGSDPSDIAEVK